MDKRVNLQSLLVAAASLAISGVVFASDLPAISAAGHSSPEWYPDRTLAWHEEFDGNTLSPGTWVHGTGGARASDELQHYRPENARVQNGYLVITAREQPFEGHRYTSSLITTRGTQAFRYGRIDIRALLPVDQGLRSSVRLLGGPVAWPTAGEIELVEIIGGQGREGTVNGTLRWGHGREHRYEGGSFILPSGTFADQFHVFSIEWDASSIRWLVDGHTYLEQDISGPPFDAFREHFYLQVELVVVGDPAQETPFPRHLVLDYIRVFE